jgi:PII-like signaling protein
VTGLSPSAPGGGSRPDPEHAPADAGCLKLTTYFGERDRTPRGLLADELLDLYARERVRASVLLRGAEGFGRLHHLHTDRLLTLSEDLPVVAVAVDRRDRIEQLIDPVLRLQRRGLVTLERTRLLDTPIEPVRLPVSLAEATKLTVHLGRQQRIGRTPAYRAICDLLRRRGITGASVLLGVDGTHGGSRMRARFFSRNAEVPLMLIAVGSGQRIAQVLPELGRLLREPLITLERVRVCKRDGELLARPHELPATDGRGLALWQKLAIYTSQDATHEGHPLHTAIMRRLRTAGLAGATSLRGIWGFHGDYEPHGDRFFQLRRRVPVLTVVIDTPDGIARAFALVDELTAEHGLLTTEMVPAARTMSATETRGGLALAAHDF